MAARAVRRAVVYIAAALTLGMQAQPLLADPVADFFAGKQMQFVIPTPAGGSYDAYGRLLAKYIVKYIPGQPSIVTVNMAGAGGIVGAQHVAMIAPKDGTVLTIVSQGLLLLTADDQKDRAKIPFDIGAMSWIGNLSSSNHVVVTWHDSPVKTLADARARQSIMGASGAGSTSVIEPVLLNQLIGTKFKLVLGYPGSAELSLAMENHEIDGYAANTWASFKAFKPEWISNHLFNLIVQIGLAKDPELPDVPLALDLATNDLDRDALRILADVAAFGRSVATSPGVPAERVAAIRRAFDAALQDPAFKIEAVKEGLEISAMNGSEVEAVVNDVVRASPPVLDRVAKAMAEPN